MSKRFAAWAAVSSLPQAKKVSLDSQRESNLEHINRHSGQLVAELLIPGESRNIVLFEEACEKIQAYAKLYELIRQASFDVLICYSRSRLGRTLALVETIAELCRRAGILIYETDSPPHSLEVIHGYTELLTGAIRSASAQEEVAKLTERNRIGMAGRTKRGKFPTSVPYGWRRRYDERGHEIYTMQGDEAAVVRFVVEQYLEFGLGTLKIAELLNERGVAAPAGGQWQRQTVQYILKRPWIYAGYAQLNRISKTGRDFVRASGDFPAIITDEQAAAVEQERRRRVESRRSVNTTYRFSQVVWCEQCDIRLHSSTEYVRHKGEYVVSPDTGKREVYPPRYRCPNWHTGGHITEANLYPAVEAAIRFIQDPKNRIAIAEAAPDRSAAAQRQIDEAIERRAVINAAIEKADDEYIDGRLPEERYRRQLDRLGNRLAAIDGELSELRAQLVEAQTDAQRGERVEQASSEGLQMLYHESLAVSNAWLRKHMRIYIRDNRVSNIDWL